MDGRTVAIEYRDAEAKYERLAAMADELVGLNPDVIFSFGGEQAPIVKAATTRIPIVVVVSSAPLKVGSWRVSADLEGTSPGLLTSMKCSLVNLLSC